jgi:ribosomal protein S18 acetylase RimI-like enzyme
VDTHITEMTIAMYEELLAFWQTMPGLYLGEESRDELAVYLKRNPELSLVALAEDRIVATLKCGHDGRRGYLHHLAVAPDWRRTGLAKELVRRALTALAGEGIRKCNTYVYDSNPNALSFWKHDGWNELPRDYATLQRETPRPGE